MKYKIPKAPAFSLAIIGPGIVLIAMGLGSGEFILWPYLVAQFGLGVLWGAVVGITFQYFVSNESGRYTLATGGSVYYAFNKLSRYIPPWFIISTFVSFAWPGIIGSGGVLFSELFGISDPRIPTIIMLLIIGLLLTFGGKVYSNLERVQKFFVAIAIPILVVIAVILVDADTVTAVGKGLIGIGEGYIFFPSGISMMAFLGAIAYSGAAGNLILSHSFYLQDEGMGMAGNMHTQIDRKQKMKGLPVGLESEDNPENLNNFRRWFKVAALEQGISFWLLGMITIILLSVISYSLVYPFAGEEGLSFVNMQAELLSGKFGSIIGIFFIVIGITFLFTTQLGIFETTSRIMTENLQLMSENIKNRFERDDIFFGFLWMQVIAAIIITMFGLEQPIQLLLLGTFFSALSMFVLSGLVYWLNTSRLLREEIRPGMFRRIILLVSTIFFGIFVAYTIYDLL